MEPTAAKPNRLIHEHSPYLSQHAYNPIAWYPWGEEAFYQAQLRDVPIFLSIGYASCHWCHVMAHESFEDPIIAELLNTHFVAIKVDREQRPDVDALYMQACIALQGQGGWPLTVFLLPDRRPFYAGSYFPPDSLDGQTGLRGLLSRIAGLWVDDRSRLIGWAEQLMRNIAISGPAPKYPGSLPGRLEADLLRAEDRLFGGIGSGPKFPNLTLLRFLMARGQTRDVSDDVWQMVSRALWALYTGGIRDHVGNGFFRYAVDAAWRTPHYEKMLQDNALLAITAMHSRTHLPAWVDVLTKSALDYLLDALKSDEQGFFSSQDADDAHGEGAYYLWMPEDIESLLGTRDGQRFCALFGIGTESKPRRDATKKRRAMRCDPLLGCALESTPEPVGFLPRRAVVFTEADESFALFALGVLARARAQRAAPDVIALCPVLGNGLAIVALAEAALVHHTAAYAQAAVAAAAFVEEKMIVEGRLMGSYSNGGATCPATLDGYAAWVWALLSLNALHPAQGWMEKAIYWCDQAEALFLQPDGRMSLSGSDMRDLPVILPATSDDAIPSGVAMMVANLRMLYDATGDARFSEQRERILTAALPNIAQSPMAHASLVAELE